MTNPIPRDELERTVERLRAELRQVYESLDRVQTRCTEQTIEIRALKADNASIIDSQVREFHDVMGIENRAELGVPSPEVVRLRMRLVIEEAFEFLIACGDLEDRKRLRMYLDDVFSVIDQMVFLDPDLVEVADALADLDYVVAGTRLAYGIPRQPVADEVHRSNMAKAPGGRVIRDSNGKVQKPAGWTPPNVKVALGLVDGSDKG